MASYHVLVVDDNHEIRRMITASIKTLGAEIDVLDVPSAEEALFISASLPLDLIVLDFRLPGMSGLEMVARLRKRKPGMKIILVTGVEDPNSRQQVIEAGVDAYFFKPIEIATFLDAVKHVLWPDQAVISVASPTPEVSAVPTATPKPVENIAPAPKEVAPTPQRFQPTLDERMNALKQQLKATLVLLVNEAGQVAEVAGNPSPITSGRALLTALIDAFQASQKISNALGRSNTESLSCFTCGRQHIYLTPVDSSNALIVVTVGYFEPDKLGLIDRAIQLAVRDLQSILEHLHEVEKTRQAEIETSEAELANDASIDQETLDLIEIMFSNAPKKGGKEKANGYWETLEENGTLDGRRNKDVLSYNQAREMGLAPEDNH